MKNVSRTKGRVPGPLKQGRAHVLRMNLTEATLIGKWLLEANEVRSIFNRRKWMFRPRNEAAILRVGLRCARNSPVLLRSSERWPAR